MLSTKDVLLRSGRMYGIWKLGMKEDSMSKEEVLSANIKNIADEVINNQENLVFQLSGLLLRGIAVLYSRKTFYIVTDCNEALQRISLKQSEKTNTKTKQKGHENGEDLNEEELDDDTLRLWENLQPLDEIIDNEREDILPTPTQIHDISAIRESSTTYVSPPEAIDDFGDEFELTLHSNAEPRQTEALLLEDDDELPEPLPARPIRSRVATSKHLIDPTPIIPMVELSHMLDDPSETLCEREQVVREADKMCKYPASKELLELFEAAKQQTPGTDERCPVDLPSVADQIEDVPDLPLEMDFLTVREEVHEQSSTLVDLVPHIRRALSEKQAANFLEVVPEPTRRCFAASFYAALSLHAEGVITLHQADYDLPISLEAGPSNTIRV